jgi:hypothetical protein
MRKEDWSHSQVILRKVFLFLSILILFVVCNSSLGRNVNFNPINRFIAHFDFFPKVKNDYSDQHLLPQNYFFNLSWPSGYSDSGITQNAEECFSGISIISFSSLVPKFQYNNIGEMGTDVSFARLCLIDKRNLI